MGASFGWGLSFCKPSLELKGISMPGTLSATSPLDRARDTTLFYYRPGPEFPSVRSIFNDLSVNDKAMHPIARAVCQVAGLYLCRIGEVLSIRLSYIIPPDRIVCRGSKRGAAYILYLPGLSAQVHEAEIEDLSVPLFPVSYSQCYRSFCRAGIRLHRRGYKNSMRCHAGRYQVAKILSEDLGVNVLSDLLHHKSKSSILYYL